MANLPVYLVDYSMFGERGVAFGGCLLSNETLSQPSSLIAVPLLKLLYQP
jgi:hypothetical protein